MPSMGRFEGIVIMWDDRTVKVEEYAEAEFSVSIRIVHNDGMEWWLIGVFGQIVLE